MGLVGYEVVPGAIDQGDVEHSPKGVGAAGIQSEQNITDGSVL